MKKIDIVLATAMLLFLVVSVSAASAEQASDPDEGAAKTQGADHSAPGYIFDIMNPQNDKPAAATEATSEDKGTAETHERDVAAPPEYYVDVLKAQDPKRAAEDVSVSPRHFLDIFYGLVTTADDSVSAFSQDDCFFFCSNTTHAASRNIHFGPSSAFGFRIGGWLKSYPRVGLAADFSYLQANAPGVNIWYLPISFVVLGRYPFLRTDSMPDGRLQLYGGLMMSEVIGDIEADFTPQMPRKVGGFSDGFNAGGGILLGIAWHFPSYAIFSEFRMIKAHLDYDSGSGLFGGSESASAELESRQMVFGVSHKF
jgi:hypothetical protein